MSIPQKHLCIDFHKLSADGKAPPRLLYSMQKLTPRLSAVYSTKINLPLKTCVLFCTCLIGAFSSPPPPSFFNSMNAKGPAAKLRAETQGAVSRAYSHCFASTGRVAVYTDGRQLSRCVTASTLARTRHGSLAVRRNARVHVLCCVEGAIGK